MFHYSIVVIANSVLVELMFILKTASINIGKKQKSLTKRDLLYPVTGF